MKTSVATSRRSDSADGSLLRLALAQGHRELERRSISDALDEHARGRLAEADQLRVLARPRGEALRHYMQRLEQVRLADAVATDDQDDPRIECEVERRV